VKLFPKYQSEISWELLRSSIWFLLNRHLQAEVTGIEMDEEQFLKAFAIPLSGASGMASGQQTAEQGVVL
jgi:hypothetical protein